MRVAAQQKPVHFPIEPKNHHKIQLLQAHTSSFVCFTVNLSLFRSFLLMTISIRFLSCRILMSLSGSPLTTLISPRARLKHCFEKQCLHFEFEDLAKYIFANLFWFVKFGHDLSFFDQRL